MGKDSKRTERRIDLVFKRKINDALDVEEDQSVPADHPLCFDFRRGKKFRELICSM